MISAIEWQNSFNTTKTQYNDIPVEFCRNAACCSLNIIEEDDGAVYCKDCGCTRTEKGHISQWEEYYFMAHGEYLMNKKIRYDTTD